jgi:hypothetical protein
MAGYHLREREFKEAGKDMLYLAHDLLFIPDYVPSGPPTLDPGQPLRPEWFEHKPGSRSQIVVPIGGLYVGSSAHVTGPMRSTLTGEEVMGSYSIHVVYE